MGKGEPPPATPQASTSALLARQPILDRKSELFAYEILYRGASIAGLEFDTVSTARVLIDSLVTIGLDHIAGEAPVFVNFGAELLDSSVLDLLSPERVVIEVLESVRPSPEIVAAVAGLAARGFRIALDDFRWQAELAPLVACADFIKIDVLACRAELEREVEALKTCGATLLAEKVETHDELRRCKALGFDLFQGYYLCRPEILDGRPLAGNQLIALDLLARLQNTHIDMKDLADTVSRDVALTYQLLRLANSPFFRQRRTIAHIQEAIVLLGLDTLRHWASILLLARLGTGKPKQLIRTALVRARMCELLSPSVGGAPPEKLFTVGLLSVLEPLLDRPIAAILTQLPLDVDVGSALSGDSARELGRTLQTVLAVECAEWNRIPRSTPVQALQAAYVEAIKFADESVTAL
jgi:EAL and modified HD-GYP domain-containing signal transduction protein